MPDTRLLLLHRAWCASRAAEDEAAYLRERVRAGELTPERLRLAANCGHLGASLAVEGAPHADEPDLGRWVYALRSWGRRGKWPPGSRVVYRVATVAAAELAVAAWHEHGPQHPGPDEALALIQSWTANDADLDPQVFTRVFALLNDAEGASEALSLFSRRRAERCLQVVRVALAVFLSPAPANASAASTARHAAKLLSTEQVRDAIAAKVIDWALSPDCPLRSA